MPWFSIYYSAQWLSFQPYDAKSAAVKNANCELVPLREAFMRVAAEFCLMKMGEPSDWAMATLLETLRFRARHPNSKPARWVHDEVYSQEYPARVEEGWITPGGEPEPELFPIAITIAPKHPDESFPAFEKRFNERCRSAREDYVATLKKEQWRKPPEESDFAWIDRLAQWQAGRTTFQIDPLIRTGSQRAAFARGLTRAADYIGITPRASKHNPKRRPGH